MADLKSFRKQLAKLQKEAERLSGEAEVVLFKDFSTDYLARKEESHELRASTKKAFAQTVRKHLIPAFGHLPLEGTDWGAEFNKWVTATRAANVGNTEPHVRRFFNHRKDLAEMLLAAHKAGLIEKKPTLENPDEKREVGRWVTDAEIISMIWKARRPFRVIFMAFYRMGCRPREILKWEWSMFRRDEKDRTWVNVPGRITKTGRSRTIPLNPRLDYILRIRQRHGNRSLYVFPKIGNPELPQFSYHAAWGRARRLAKVAKCVPYDMRRSIISRWARDGIPISYAARLLDSSPTMLQDTYTRFDSEKMTEIIS